jgi:hypothetical protein
MGAGRQISEWIKSKYFSDTLVDNKNGNLVCFESL